MTSKTVVLSNQMSIWGEEANGKQTAESLFLVMFVWSFYIKCCTWNRPTKVSVGDARQSPRRSEKVKWMTRKP